MKNTILNGSLTFQTLPARVRALKVASMAVVAGILALTGNASALPSDTVITINNGATDLTTAASYSIVTNTAGAITVAPGVTPSATTDILFFNNGLVPGGATLDLYSVPYLSPTLYPFVPTVDPGPLTVTVNSSLTTASINDANQPLPMDSILITNTAATPANVNLTITGGINNTNATPVATATTPVGTGAGNSADLIYTATGADLSFQNGTGADTLTLLLPNSGNIDSNGFLSINSAVTITTGKTITFTGTGASTGTGGETEVDGAIGQTGSSASVVIGTANSSVSVIFGGVNTYTGATTITAATTPGTANNLVVDNVGALGGTSGVTVTGSGAALLLAVTPSATVPLFLNGNGTGVGSGARSIGALENIIGTNSYSGLITLQSNATIAADSGTTLNITNVGTIGGGANALTFAGAGNGTIASIIVMTNIIKIGTGTWILTGANTSTGFAIVDAGILQVGNGTSGSLSTADTLVTGGGTFVLLGKTTGTTSQTVDNLDVGSGANIGAGEVTVNANGGGGTVLNLGTIVNNGNGSTVDFTLPSGTQSVTNGITTTNTNTNGILSGYTTVGGTTWATETATVITGLANGSYVTTTTAGNTAATYANANIDVTSSPTPGALITPNSLRFNDTGTAANASETLTLQGANVIESGGILVTTGVGTGTSTITGGSITSGTAQLSIIQNNTAGALTISSTITGGIVLAESGSGQLNLFGANNYTGGTSLNGSTIEIGTGVTGPATITPFGSGTVNINATTTITTDGANTGGDYTVANTFVLNAPLTVTVSNATGPVETQLDLTGPISGSSSLNVASGFISTLNLSGALTYTGGTTITSGNLSLTGAATTLGGTAGVGGPLAVIAGSTLNNNTGATLFIGSLSGSGGSINNGNNLLTVTQTTAGTYQGTITGAGGLTLSGSGAAPLSLTGASSYSGGTTISAGAVLAAGNLSALGTGAVTNSGLLETTATTLAGAPQTINVGNPAGPLIVSNYSQTTTGVLVLQVVSNQGVQVQTQAAAGLGESYDTLAATGSASFTAAPSDVIALNFQGAAPALAGQRFQVVSVPGALNTALVTSSSATTPTAVTTTGNINPYIIPITSYNDSFNGAFANNNIIVTLFQPFTTFTGLTPNQTAVANNLDNIANNLFNPASPFAVTTQNGVILTPLSGVNKDFFDNILEGVELAGGAGNVGHALDELSPQRYEVLRNVAFDNYAFDIQGLDQEFARERMGVGGVDTAGFTFNNSQLGPELSQARSRLLAWSPAPEPGLLSDSSQAVLGGVAMVDKKDVKEMAPETPENLWNVFIDGGVDLGDKDSNEDLSHSSYTTGRVRVGADYRVCTDLRVGALFGYGHTDADLDNEGSKAHVDSYTPGVFLSYADKDGFYANGLFTYTDNEYSTHRDIVIPGVNRTADGSFSGNQFGGDLDGGYDFHRGDWTFGPSAGLTYVNLDLDSFTESGAGAADLGVNSQSSDSLRSRLGGTASYRTEIGSVVLTPHVSAYWQHEFLDDSTNITSSFVGLPGGSFAVQTTKGDKDNALVGAGLNAELNQTVTLFVDYGAEAGGSTFFGQSATGGVKIGF